MAPRKRARAESSAFVACDLDCEDATVLAQRAKTAGEIYKAGDLCDGTVSLQGRTYPVSRMLLSAASPFFRLAFTSSMREGSGTVELDSSLQPACVEALLALAHAPQRISVPEGDIENLFLAADQLQFNDMLPKITALLSATTSLANCITHLSLGARHSLSELADGAIRIIGENLAEVTASPAWLSLPRDALVQLLQSDFASGAHPKESSLLEAAQNWVAHDSARAGDFERLIECIRLPELGAEYLVSHLMHSPAILASARAQQLVREALLFLTVPAQRATLTSPRTLPRDHAEAMDVTFVPPPPSISDGVALEAGGKVVARTGHAYWRGARAAQRLEGVHRWTLVVRTVDFAGLPTRFFFGVARADVETDDRQNIFKEEGKVGVNFHAAQAGDEFTITADRRRNRVAVSAKLVGGRTELPGLAALKLQLEWSPTADSDWRPFVQMTHPCKVQVV